MRARSSLALHVLTLAGLSLSLAGCEWFSDFKRQPSVVTWETLRPDTLMVRGSPQGSVPTTGTEMPAFRVSYAAMPSAIDSMGAELKNPVPMSEESLTRGHLYFQLNCAVCHGDLGKGDGPATRYGMAPMSLMTDIMKGRPDGYIFGMIRNGRVLMPSYNRIEEMNRWDIVNYIRALQGGAGGLTFAVGPLAKPGVTGDKLPGPTELGPTRAVPFIGPNGIGPLHPAATADSARTGTSRGTAGGDA